MRISGEWLACDDGIVRPVIRVEVLARDGIWRSAELLLDTGADRTVLSANILDCLRLPFTVMQDRIGGVGGIVESVAVKTRIRMPQDDGTYAVFRGEFAACVDRDALDMSVLGRDILDMFAVIVDRPGELVAVIGGQHHYALQTGERDKQ
ncbi:MAG: hypothetical protein NTY19_43035 [Planctomycetota bacterium]|nr:hypothetical protein [Planctomycetota bacterium]